MADNTTLNVGAGGDAVRDIDRSLNAVPIAAKTQVVQLDAGGQTAESLVSQANPMPVVQAFMAGDAAYQNALIYAELRLMTQIIANGLSLTDDLAAMRADPSYLA